MAKQLIYLIQTHYPSYAARAKAIQLMDVNAKNYYGEGYQDVELRVPAIHRAEGALAFKPKIDILTGLRKTLDFYLQE